MGRNIEGFRGGANPHKPAHLSEKHPSTRSPQRRTGQQGTLVDECYGTRQIETRIDVNRSFKKIKKIQRLEKAKNGYFLPENVFF